MVRKICVLKQKNWPYLGNGGRYCKRNCIGCNAYSVASEWVEFNVPPDTVYSRSFRGRPLQAKLHTHTHTHNNETKKLATAGFSCQVRPIISISQSSVATRFSSIFNGIFLKIFHRVCRQQKDFENRSLFSKVITKTRFGCGTFFIQCKRKIKHLCIGFIFLSAVSQVDIIGSCWEEDSGYT